jgi:hypothetical protein
VTAICSGCTVPCVADDCTEDGTEAAVVEQSSYSGRAGGDSGTFLDGDILSFPFRRGDALLSSNRGERGSRRAEVDTTPGYSGFIPCAELGMLLVGMLLVGKEASGEVLAMPTPLIMSAAQLHFSCRPATSCGKAMIQFGIWPTPRATQYASQKWQQFLVKRSYEPQVHTVPSCSINFNTSGRECGVQPRKTLVLNRCTS